MNYHNKTHVKRVSRELSKRYSELIDSLNTHTQMTVCGEQCVRFASPMRIRLAIEDFKTVLAETKRLAK
jgi:hypothetical protein